MELEGTVHDGVIIPDDATELAEGQRVRITIAEQSTRTFGERFAQFKGVMEGLPEDASISSTRSWLLELAKESERLAPDLPSDMAEQHDHYAHGKPRS